MSERAEGWGHIILTGLLVGFGGMFLTGTGLEEEIAFGLSGTVGILGLMVHRAITGGRAKAVRAGEADLADRVALLEARLAELDPVPERILELEERMDFSERLLAEGRQEQGTARPDA